ncbi:MAG TPA: hypothetical protein VE398_10050 [Acidobacteriota bacterium]|nr:hypothetical protein [Acidobacteriota bacterium]
MKLYSGGLVLCAGLIAAALAGCSGKDEGSQASGTLKPDAAHSPSGAAAGPASGSLKFTAPAGWVSEQPSSSMRKAQYRLPRAQGDSEDAEMVVFYFQGGGGGVQANIDRWIGQFSKPDGSPANDIAKVTKKVVHDVPVTMVDVNGIYSGAMGPMGSSSPAKSNYRMLAAVAEASDGPWFFKLTGPEKTVTHWESSFASFVDSFQQ